MKKCHNCGKTGHLRCVCRSGKLKGKQKGPKKNTAQKAVHYLKTDSEEEWPLHCVCTPTKQKSAQPPLMVKVQLDNCCVFTHVQLSP